MTRLGKYLSLLRGERGWSLRETAKRSERSHAYLHEIEAGAKHPSAVTAMALADVLGGTTKEALRLWVLDRVESVKREADAAPSTLRSEIRGWAHRIGSRS